MKTKKIGPHYELLNTAFVDDRLWIRAREPGGDGVVDIGILATLEGLSIDVYPVSEEPVDTIISPWILWDDAKEERDE